MGVMMEVIVEAPTGSTATDISPTFSPFVAATTALDSLANNAQTSTLSYPNAANTTNATVLITLNQITPTAGGKVQITNGTNGYEMSVSTTTGGKSLRFINIPTSILSSFTVKNLCGVTLASSGNSVVILPEY